MRWYQPPGPSGTTAFAFLAAVWLLTGCSSSSASSAAPTYLSVGSGTDGLVLTEAGGYVVYTYAGDRQGQPSTCTGGCLTGWTPLNTGDARFSPADHIPGRLGTSNGQVTYNGWPLYLRKGARIHQDSAGGPWRDVSMEQSYIIGA